MLLLGVAISVDFFTDDIVSEVCVVVVTLIYWLDVPVSCSSIIVVLPLSPYWPAIVVVSELDVIAFSLLLDPVLDIADVEYEGVLSIPLLYEVEYIVSLLQASIAFNNDTRSKIFFIFNETIFINSLFLTVDCVS